MTLMATVLMPRPPIVNDPFTAALINGSFLVASSICWGVLAVLVCVSRDKPSQWLNRPKTSPKCSHKGAMSHLHCVAAEMCRYMLDLNWLASPPPKLSTPAMAQVFHGSKCHESIETCSTTACIDNHSLKSKLKLCELDRPKCSTLSMGQKLKWFSSFLTLKFPQEAGEPTCLALRSWADISDAPSVTWINKNLTNLR